MAHFLPLKKEKKTAADLAVLFAREVWKHHGLATDIVSDRNSRFASETWQEFLWLSGIRPRMSNAFQPQTDGKTERLNQTIEAYLRAFVGHEQDHWVGLLPIAEFAYNNSITTGYSMSPFYANYGFHPVSSDPAASGPLNPASKPTPTGCTRYKTHPPNNWKQHTNECATTQIPSAPSPRNTRLETW